MAWSQDLAAWISNWETPTAERVRVLDQILRRRGWDPERYSSRMRDDLFQFLDIWHQLGRKVLPAPPHQSSPVHWYNKDYVGQCGHFSDNLTTAWEEVTCERCRAAEESI